MRSANLPTIPQQNENHRLVRVVFRRSDLENSRILAVEQSTYFATGRSPVHAESHSEEIMYFRRGRGQVLLGDRYVDVGPGSAVTIPSAIEHHVVNTGEDLLEHILISAEIGGRPPQGDALPKRGDYLIEEASRKLSRLSCRKVIVPEGQNGESHLFPDHEAVYAISSGVAIAHVKLPGTDYEWQYALDASNCFWFPAGLPHYFRNIGDCPLQLVNFLCLATA